MKIQRRIFVRMEADMVDLVKVRLSLGDLAPRIPMTVTKQASYIYSVPTNISKKKKKKIKLRKKTRYYGQRTYVKTTNVGT